MAPVEHTPEYQVHVDREAHCMLVKDREKMDESWLSPSAITDEICSEIYMPRLTAHGFWASILALLHSHHMRLRLNGFPSSALLI